MNPVERIGEPIVDAQVHLGGGRYRPAQDYVAAMGTDRVDQAVLVQRFGSTDNAPLAAAAREHPGRFVVVAAVDELSRAWATQSTRWRRAVTTSASA